MAKIQSSSFIIVPTNAMTASRAGYRISHQDTWQIHTFTSQQMSRMTQRMYDILKEPEITMEDYTLVGRIEQLWQKYPELKTGGTST